MKPLLVAFAFVEMRVSEAVSRTLDKNKDGFISVTEFDRYARDIKFALSLCNDFVTRHDLDGDQKVSRREFKPTDSMFHRMDRNMTAA